jgi:hypothetical protein
MLIKCGFQQLFELDLRILIPLNDNVFPTVRLGSRPHNDMQSGAGHWLPVL